MVLRFWSMRTLGAHFTRTLCLREGQQIVTSGPYALVRHPGYTSTGAMFVPLATLSTGADIR